ncbi:MFS transporter [Sulfurimonas sp. HSL-3221]|uniref:MFS transporter n=1 Tax=Thiomicrolovo sulfuroxydans TaxID=2894755 RepID=UPI001E563208|nr:MFS transporter [Sulfurimonas sp. HSL-3221]UFS62447.1 MFS transporter [Sulfurimonas sp. HSL-3221]
MTLLVSAFYFFYFAIIGVYVIFMPKVLEMVGYAPSEIGIIFASAPLVRFAVPFAFMRGLRLDRTVFNAALLLMLAAAAAFFPALPHFWALLAANITLGIGLSLILPYIEVIVLELIGKERYGKVRLYGSIGFILVALALVKVLDAPQTALFFLMGTTLLTALFGYSIARHDAKKQTEVPAAAEHSAFTLLTHPGLWLGFLLMQISFGPFYNFFTIYETAHGVSLDMTIYLWSFGVIAEIVLFYFQGPLLRRNLHRLLEFAAGVTVIRWLIVWQFPENLPLLFAAQSMHAISFALFHTAAISYLYTLFTQKKLAQQFFFGISYGLGGFIGAVGSGYVYEYAPASLFLTAAIASALALLALRRG